MKGKNIFEKVKGFLKIFLAPKWYGNIGKKILKSSKNRGKNIKKSKTSFPLLGVSKLIKLSKSATIFNPLLFKSLKTRTNF